MLRILLINPPFNIAKENYDSSVSVGLLSIGTYLDNKGIKVKIIDGARQKNFWKLVEQEAKVSDYAGLSVMTTQVPGALKVSEIIRQTNFGCKIIWGGTHPTFFPEQTIKHRLVDVVVYGEGEETFYEIASSRDLAEIKGIIFKDGDRIVTNPPRELCNPMTMPLFNWDLVPSEILQKIYLVPSLTSRGCPHRCTFCINAILKNKWRFRTAIQVLEDLSIIKSKPYFKDKPLRFWDENFFVDLGRARAIVDGMISQGLVIPWETTVRAGYIKSGMIDDEFMAKLKESGCYLLSFGAESGSPEILKKIKKEVTPEEIINSAKACIRYNIIPQYSFMIGLPGESKKDMYMTLNLIDKLIKLSPKVQILGPQAFRPYPGSELYQECIASGWQEPKSLEEWSHLIENELNYLTVQNFPWVRNKDFVESMEAYVRFGALSIKSALASSVKAQKYIKLAFILLCRLRWKLKFFAWPIEFKLAKKFVTK
jgi:anaerobic magnesium-protoporphyrin IX monomethyl ester cyclase